MGGGISKSIEYNSCNPEEQLKILEDFKTTYSDTCKNCLCVSTTELFEPLDDFNKYFYINSNNYRIKIKSKTKTELLDFVCKIGRPFTLTTEGDLYLINFVYMPNINIENKKMI